MTNFIHWPYANPIFIDIGLTIHWYGAIFALGILLAQKVLVIIYQKEARAPQEIDSLVLLAVILGVIGARLAHCLFYEPKYYLANPIEILKIWEGGLASHGGLAGFLLGVYIHTKDMGRPKLIWLLDRLTIPLCIVSCFVRIANFVNGEIYGTVTTLPWAIIFDKTDPEQLPRHPVQLYEAFVYLATFILLSLIYKHFRATNKKPLPGLLFGLFLMLISIARFSLEFLKSSQSASDINSIISTGQWLTIPVAAIGLIVLLTIPYRQRHQQTTN